MTETWTIGKIIPWAAQYLAKYQVGAPRLSGELMLCQVLGLRPRGPLSALRAAPEPPGTGGFQGPATYVGAGRSPWPTFWDAREFYGLDLAVGPGVLVPRPESEHLVEEALKRLRGQDNPRLLDLCAGSGAVALACLANHPSLTAVGVDLSPPALEFARQNAASLGLEGRVQWLLGDLWEPLAAGGGFFEVITANPPYVRDDEWPGLPAEVRDYEPRQALWAGDEGLDIIAPIVQGARAYLRPLGWLFIELGQGQAAQAQALARGVGIYQQVSAIPDLAGIERVLCCQRGDWG